MGYGRYSSGQAYGVTGQNPGAYRGVSGMTNRRRSDYSSVPAAPSAVAALGQKSSAPSAVQSVKKPAPYTGGNVDKTGTFGGYESSPTQKAVNAMAMKDSFSYKDLPLIGSFGSLSGIPSLFNKAIGVGRRQKDYRQSFEGLAKDYGYEYDSDEYANFLDGSTGRFNSKADFLSGSFTDNALEGKLNSETYGALNLRSGLQSKAYSPYARAYNYGKNLLGFGEEKPTATDVLSPVETRESTSNYGVDSATGMADPKAYETIVSGKAGEAVGGMGVSAEAVAHTADVMAGRAGQPAPNPVSPIINLGANFIRGMQKLAGVKSSNGGYGGGGGGGSNRPGPNSGYGGGYGGKGGAAGSSDFGGGW